MKAKALICNENQEFSIEAVVLEDPTANQIVIRNHYSGVSIGTEFAVIKKKIFWGNFPTCTGYMGTGIVEQVGDNIKDFAIGDKVYYRKNEPMTLASNGTPVSNTGGVHCSRIVIDPSDVYGAAHLPPGADMEKCCMFVMPAVGLHGVNMANPRMGEIVVVHGCGMIGLGSIAACVNRGCTVIAVDLNRKRLDVASKLGAKYLIDGQSQNLEAEVSKIAPNGVDLVIECTGIPEHIDKTVPLCRLYGKFTWQGNYGDKPVSIDYQQITGRKLTMFFPCDDGLQPCRSAVINSMTTGMLPWQYCITHRITADEAPELYRRINTGEEKDLIGAVICWKE